MHTYTFVLVLNCALLTYVTGEPGYAKNEVVMKREHSAKPRYCQSQTPCSWQVYDNYYSFEQMLTVLNVYCVCRPGTTCQFHAKRADSGYIENRCRPLDNGGIDDRKSRLIYNTY